MRLRDAGAIGVGVTVVIYLAEKSRFDPPAALSLVLLALATLLIAHGVGLGRGIRRILPVTFTIETVSDRGEEDTKVSVARSCWDAAIALDQLVYAYGDRPRLLRSWRARAGERRALALYRLEHRVDILAALDIAAELGHSTLEVGAIASSAATLDDLAVLRGHLGLLAEEIGGVTAATAADRPRRRFFRRRRGDRVRSQRHVALRGRR
jgi:hypothetical protein